MPGGRSGERRNGELQQELPQPSSLPLGSSLLPFDSGRLTRPPLRDGRWDGQAGCHVASKSVIMLTIVLETAYLAISGDGRAALITASAPRCLFLLGITGIPSGMEEGVLGLPRNQVKNPLRSV